MNVSATQQERTWLQRLQQHDEQALACLMQAYYTPLYNYGIRFMPDSNQVKDCIQEVFISLWQRRESACTILSLRFYLLRAVKNQALKILHQRKKAEKYPGPLPEYDFLQEFSVETFIIDKQVAEEKVNMLKKTLAQLSRRQHEVIHLKFYQQLDNAQIAELMNISRQSVYNLLHETILKIRHLWQVDITNP